MSWDSEVIPGWYEWLDREWKSGGESLFDTTEMIWRLHIATSWDAGALDGWATGESLILMCLKLLAQTIALYESHARSRNDQPQIFLQRARWYAIYQLFAAEVRRQGPAALRWIHDQVDDRLGKVVLARWEQWDEYWIQDLALPPNPGQDGRATGRLVAKGHSGEGSQNDPVAYAIQWALSWSKKYGPYLQIDNMALAYRDYIAGTQDGSQPGIAGGLDNSFTGVVSAIAKWEEQLRGWTSQVPPAAVRYRPSWTIGPATGQPWPTGVQTVRYAYSLGGPPGDPSHLENAATGPAGPVERPNSGHRQPIPYASVPRSRGSAGRRLDTSHLPHHVGR